MLQCAPPSSMMRRPMATMMSKSSRCCQPRLGVAGRRHALQIVCQAGNEPVEELATTAAPPAAAAPLLPPPGYPYPPPGYYAPPVDLAAQGLGATEGVASYTLPPPDPRLYAAGGQQLRSPQDYYMAYYPPPPPPTPVYKEEAAAGGLPWFVWMGLGAVVGQVLIKVQEFMKNPKTPQQMMAEMAMKQMMGAMGNGAPGASPFGAPGASPFGAPGASPFAGFPTPPPAAGGPTSTFDTTASAVSSRDGGAASGSNNGSAGSKFASRLNSEGREAPKAEATKQRLDVVEPLVKEPSASSSSSSGSSSSSSSSSGAGRPRSSFFTDVDASAGASASQGASTSSSSSGTSAPSEDATVMSKMMEQMLRNPEMQKMLYPYLPENMRNPQSIEFMLNNPEVRKQMEQMFASQNSMSPQMMDMMKNMDFNQDKVNQQFAELGLKPEDVVSKVMQNPDLAAGFSNPKVQAAIIDISANPMNIVKYQNDPEVMKVLEKVTEVFQPQIPPNMR